MLELHSFVLSVSVDLQGHWMPALGHRFPAIVSIRGRGYEHVCTGVLISSRFILTAANCVDVVGPNPIAVISPRSTRDNRLTDGVQVAQCISKWLIDVRGISVIMHEITNDL